ncbi:MAG: DNA-3-methyladenine glycosylase [Anaerosomatales bacterium]|nr:DNA-3-methyladenine glycosylase [Anaerosomatales bacterium]
MEAFDPRSARPLGATFFARDTRIVARELLGCVLVSDAEGARTAGRIVETEAYLGNDDPGSHAATRGVTARNRVMYGPPGRAYVYFTYGNHHMLNFVTEVDGVAGAVLIRALEPLVGLEVMAARRGRSRGLCDGPGKLAQALGVDLADNGAQLGDGKLTVYAGTGVSGTVKTTGRVGLSAGHELELRFLLAGNEHVSKGRTGPRSSGRRRS